MKEQVTEEICEECGVIKVEGLCNCSLEEEAAEEEQEEMTPEEFHAREREKALERIYAELEGLPGAPTREMIAQWQVQHGTVYVLKLSPKDMFIWRPILSQEWIQFQSNKALIQSPEKLQGAVVNRCLLWPKLGPAQWPTQRAGLMSTLFEVMMKGSYFLDVNEALAMTYEF